MNKTGLRDEKVFNLKRLLPAIAGGLAFGLVSYYSTGQDVVFPLIGGTVFGLAWILFDHYMKRKEK